MEKRVTKPLVKRIRSKIVRLLRPVHLPFMGRLPIVTVIKFFIRNVQRESITVRASSIAFNLFLSLFPALIFTFTLLPYIPIHGLADELNKLMKDVLPKGSYIALADTINDILYNPRYGLLSVGLLATLYFASNGINSMMASFNSRDNRSFLQLRFIALSLTVILGLLILIAIFLLIFGQKTIEFVITHTAIADSLGTTIVFLLQWIVVLALVFFGCTILYKLGDSHKKPWRHVYPGASLASVLIILTSFGYAFYVAKFANYNKLYGSIGALIVTMLWLYFNSLMLIIGFEFNKSLSHTKAFISKRIIP